MSLMQWDDTMSVGVDEMDEQHKALIAMINEAFEAIQRHDEHMLSALIDKMREYAIMHFHAEEELLEKYGFPELEEHRRLHDAFNDKVDEFQQNLFAKTNLSQIFVFLSRWLTNHIMEEDKKYTQYVPQEEEKAEK